MLASDWSSLTILTSDWLTGVTEPLRPDVPIFGTQASPLPPAPAPPLHPSADLKDTPHQVNRRHFRVISSYTILSQEVSASPALDPSVLAGMPPPDPAALADSVSAMSIMTPASPVTPANIAPSPMAAPAPSNIMPTPDLAPGNLMPAAPQVMATPETQVMAPVLNPAILAGMPAPDPALLASMNLSMPQVTLDTVIMVTLTPNTSHLLDILLSDGIYRFPGQCP